MVSIQKGTDSVHHVVVPELHDSAGLFVAETARVLLVEQFAAPEPETAAMTVHRLMTDDATLVIIHGCSNDMRACRVLQSELRRSGLTADIVIAQTCHDEARSADGILGIEAARDGGKDALVAFDVALRACIQERGPDLVRMQTPTLCSQLAEQSVRASPFPASLGLNNKAWRDLLLDLVAEFWPGKMAAWVSLLQADELGVNPIEAVYAGQHLRTRNRDLLVNIL